MEPDVRTELLKLQSAGRTEYQRLAGCIQSGRDGSWSTEKQGIVRKRSIWSGSIGGHALLPCASRFPVGFAGINIAVLSTQRGTICPGAAPKHNSVTATDD